jgi:hypothetical protein
MTETIHIFDEFLEENLTKDQRHQKRVRVEPLLFDILKAKYGSTLRENWLKNPPPLVSEKCILLIERRIHENLEFVFHNAVQYGKGWSICFVCSDINYNYCKEITQNHPNIHFIPIFQGSPSYSEAREEYNKLLMSTEFYEALPWKNICIMQTDSYLRKQIPESVLNYDYIASPALWDENELVGGLSFRSKEGMIKITREYKETISSEDLFISKGCGALGLKKPIFEEAMLYCAESCLYEDPVGVHQWWTFFFITLDDAELIFHSLVTLDTIS